MLFLSPVGPSTRTLTCLTVSQEEMRVERVPFLSHDPSPDRFGYLVFLKLRSGNPVFWKWYLTTVVLPFFKDIKAALFGEDVAVDYDEERNGPGAPRLPSKLGVYTTDGEAGQTQAVNRDPTFLQLLDEAGVAQNKHGCGASLSEQPCDLSPIFMSTKSTLKNANGDDLFNPSLAMALAKALTALKDKGVAITPLQEEKYNSALQSVVAALSIHVSPKNIRSGFTRSGMVGDPETWNTVTRRVPFSRPAGGRGQTTPYYNWSAKEWDDINANFDGMVEKYIEKGRLTDEYLDSIGMHRLASLEGVEKDELVEYRWRSAWLNNEKVIAELKARASAKLAAEASAALARQEAVQRKENKGEGAKLLEEKILPLVEGLKTLFDEVEAAVKQCSESTKTASKSKSEGVKDCETAKKKAKDEEVKVHSLWAGGRASGTEARKAASEGNLDLLNTIVVTLTSTTTTAKASRDSAVSAAADAKTAAAKPPALVLPPIPGATKKGKGPKVPETADTLRASMAKIQAQLAVLEAAEAAAGDGGDSSEEMESVQAAEGDGDEDPREETEVVQSAKGGSGAPKRGRGAAAASSQSPDPKARSGKSRYGRPTGSGWGTL